MAMLGNPDYSRATVISVEDFLKLTQEEILYSYTIIKGKFDFPSATKYPSIPCYLDCIKELQSKRREYEKGTINNALYKEIGNSIYGLVVRGINNKMKFDIKSGKTIRMNSNDLSNPIIAS